MMTDKLKQMVDAEIGDLSSELRSPDGKSFEFKLPSIATRGRLVVEVWPGDDEWKYEIRDYDAESAVFWISEGFGFDWWLEHNVKFTAPGLYLIENIHGKWICGAAAIDPDGVDEEWQCDAPRLITIDDAKALGFLVEAVKT